MPDEKPFFKDLMGMYTNASLDRGADFYRD